MNEGKIVTTPSIFQTANKLKLSKDFMDNLYKLLAATPEYNTALYYFSNIWERAMAEPLSDNPFTESVLVKLGDDLEIATASDCQFECKHLQLDGALVTIFIFEDPVFKPTPVMMVEYNAAGTSEKLCITRYSALVCESHCKMLEKLDGMPKISNEELIDDVDHETV